MHHTTPPRWLSPIATTRRFILTVGMAAGLSSLASAQDVTIPKKEWEQMKREMSQMRSELNAMKQQKPTRSEGGGGASSAAIAALNQKVDDLAGLTKPGESKFHLAGSASATFISPNRDNSNFEATFSPILLWHINDKLLFEAEVEFELSGHETETKLEYAALEYSLTDNLTLIGGKFLNPMNAFVERYEAKWVNRLPDTPLAIYDGILPESNVGFQLRGAYPIGSVSKINFAAYVSNAPSLTTDDSEAAGTLDFDNFTSSHDNKAVGGRIGLQFCPNFEIGYGVQYARVRGDEGGQSVSSLQQSIDLLAFADWAKGRWTLWGQYAWSNVGNREYDVLGETDEETGVFTPGDHFSNKRSGGYAQVSYRGKEWDSDLMNRLEFIIRADTFNQPNNAPGAFDEKRLTFGVDYWLTSYYTALKAAWEIDDRDGDRNHNTFLIGVATGL